MTGLGGWPELVRALAPAATGFGTGLLVLRLLMTGPSKGRGVRGLAALCAPPTRGLISSIGGGAVAGIAAAVVVALGIGRNPLSGSSLLFFLAAQLYLLALAAALSSWRMPLAEVIALVLFVPAIPLQLLVHAGVLPISGGPALYFLPPASFMVDLPIWAVGTWRGAGWNPLAWPRGMAGPGFGRGALVWTLHVGLFLGLARWGRRRRDRKAVDPGALRHSR